MAIRNAEAYARLSVVIVCVVLYVSSRGAIGHRTGREDGTWHPTQRLTLASLLKMAAPSRHPFLGLSSTAIKPHCQGDGVAPATYLAADLASCHES